MAPVRMRDRVRARGVTAQGRFPEDATVTRIENPPFVGTISGRNGGPDMSAVGTDPTRAGLAATIAPRMVRRRPNLTPSGVDHGDAVAF